MADRSGDHPTRWAQVSPPFIGRRGELDRARAALGRAVTGAGGVLVIVGEAGIGKSRLADAVTTEAVGRGLPVMHGRAVQAATASAYRPLAEALSSAVRAGAAPDASSLGPFRTTLALLIPEWRSDDQSRRDESHVAVAEGVLRFVREAAGNQGAVIVLEDLHWADPETVTVVDYLADNLATERVLCVVTVRDDPAGVELVQAVRSRRAASILPLGPLDGDEVAAMVAGCLGAPEPPEAVVRFARRGEGVPFMVEELLVAAVATGALVEEDGSWRVTDRVDSIIPASLADGMRRRVRELGASAEQVLVSAAVLGRRFDWSLLPAVTRLPDAEVLRELHAAVDAKIVSFERGDGTFSFRHALSREAVLAVLFPMEQEALAQRALEVVESAHPDLHGEWADLAADLAARAGEDRRASKLLLASARTALRQGALVSAETTLDGARALVADDDPLALDVDEALVEVLSTAGKPVRAAEVGAAALARLGTASRTARRRCGIHLRLARAAVAAGRWEDSLDHIESARRAADETSAEDLRARVDVVAAQIAISRSPGDAPVLAQAALSVAVRAGLADVECEALEVLGRTQRPVDLEAAEQTFERVLAVAATTNLSIWRPRALHELGAIDMLRGRGVRRLEEARELALEHGAVATAAVVDVQIAAALVIGDDPREGGDAARRSIELSRRYRFDQTLAAALALEAYEHARLRRRPELRRCVEEAQSLAAGVPDIEVKAATARAFSALVEEDRTAARHHLCVGLKAAARGGDYSAVPAIGLLGLLREVDGAEDEAPEIEIPENSVHFLASAYLRYGAAVAAGRGGRTDLAVESLQQADDMLAGHAWCRHLGRRLVADAAVEGWVDPVPSLLEALTFFDSAGDEPLASACRSLLRKAGAKVPRRRQDPTVPGDLRTLGITARELEVLHLVGQGLTNKDIGARLYLSPRTVERHVANLVTKLGADRRSSLVAYAARTVGSGRPTA